MKVSEAIALLQTLPQDLDLMVAYDSFCCIYDVDPALTMVVEKEGEGKDDQQPGVYLCAMDRESLGYYVGDMTNARLVAPEQDRKTA